MRSHSSGGPGSLRRALICLAVVAFLAVAGTLPAAAQERPPGGILASPVVRAIDLASPAVVRIATLYSAHLTLTACGATTTLPASGAYTVGGLGSGAFVSANGDVLTADHVVNIDRQSLDDSIFTGAQASMDVATFLNAVCHPTVPVTADEVANGLVQFNGFPFTTSYAKPHVLVWRSTSYLGEVHGGAASATPSRLRGLLKAPYNEAKVLTSSSFGQNDLALIHVDLSDTPSIQLGPSSQLAVEDTLAVIGFPGNGDVNADPTNLLTPSVNNVSVSALKRNDNGSQLIQVGGNVEHGDSGGPALDSAGHIVGIVSFGGADTPGITAFLRSGDNARDLLSAANVSTAPGTFQTLWVQAFADYVDTSAGHWHAAAREMDALSARYPDFHGLDTYRAYADNAALSEASSSSAFTFSNLPLPLPIMAAFGAGLLALVLLVIVVIGGRSRARRRAKHQAAIAAQSYNAATSPAYQPPAYNAAAGPTRPAIPPQSGPSAYPPQPYPQSGYSPQYSGSTSQRYAPQREAMDEHWPMSGQMPTGNGVGSGADSSRGYDARPRSASESSQNGGASAYCMNGHQMPPGVTRCLVCGATRQAATSKPQDVPAPPWSQNW